MYTKLYPYRAQFKAIVVRHIKEDLDSQEWARLRSLAGDRARASVRNAVPDVNATPQVLVDQALSIDALALHEILTPAFKARAVKIGTIEESPVYYVDKEGIYLWALASDDSVTMSIWATHPAYPPSW